MKRKILLAVIILSISTILSLTFANNCTISAGSSNITENFILRAVSNTISNGFHGAIVGLVAGLFNNILNGVISFI